MFISIIIVVLTALPGGLLSKRVETISHLKTLDDCYQMQLGIINKFEDTDTIKLVSVTCQHQVSS